MTPGDRETRFRELSERSCARWAGIARAYSGNSDRDDLLQEILLQIWKSLDRFDGRSSPETWAYRIALNTALAWNRNHRTRANLLKSSTTDVASLAGEIRGESSEMRVLAEFLKSLSPGDRAVMLLFLDDVSSADAAEILGTTEGALRVRMHRIRKRFEETYCDAENEQ
ncbi:MAG: RNA polymerase sigma factor [Planctomycetaceae bacterium]